jgi:ribose transport system permease protein
VRTLAPSWAASLPRPRTAQMPTLLAWASVGALFVAGTLSIEDFASLPSVRSLLILGAILGIASAGQTLVVVMGGLDLSIAGIMTMTNVMIPHLMATRGFSAEAAIALTLGISAIIGAASGFTSRILRVHPLLITLGVGFMLSGLLLAWTGGAPQGSAPTWLTSAVSAATHMGPIPLPPVVAVWAGVAVVMWVLLNRTTFGRQVYALGASPEAAEYALVRPVRVWTIAFALSAVLACVAGLMLSGFTGYGDVNSGDPYLFDSVAAVVVGGTSLLGGRGGYGRTIAGSLILVEIQTLLVGLGVEPATQDAALGVIIVAFVALYGRERHIRLRM